MKLTLINLKVGLWRGGDGDIDEQPSTNDIHDRLFFNVHLQIKPSN